MYHVGPLPKTTVAAYLGSDSRTVICTTLTFVTLQHSTFYSLGNIGLI